MTVAPYGSWRSPITASEVARSGLNVSQPRFDGADLYWIEGRAAERGRNAIVRLRPGGEPEDVTPSDFNARTMVHEYGGGDYTVAGSVLYAARFEDQRLYRIQPGVEPVPLTPPGKARYADLELDVARARIICIREEHARSDQECVNELVAVPAAGGEPVVLATGRDFYSTPRLSPDGHRIAWLEWDHPLMPWDGTELWTAEVAEDGTLSGRRRLAGSATESIFQPEWSPGGELHFVSDRTGWWNLYRAGDAVEAVLPMEAEFGLPQWAFGMRTYAFDGDRILAAYNRDGLWHLAWIDEGELRPIDLPFTSYGSPAAGAGRAVVLAASPSTPSALIELTTEKGYEVVKSTASRLPDPAYIPQPEAVTFPTAGGGSAYGLLYRPTNPDFHGEGPPPLIVSVHGGPTSAARSSYSASIAYFTSRGFALLDLNYRGSTGYGRPFRDALYGQWGVADVEDAVAVARFLAERGDADPRLRVVAGGSAGGYTALAVAAFEPGGFACGTSYFGICDLEVFDRDTHKFEAKYLRRLIGGEQNYKARSPISRSDEITMPMLVLQGLDDRIVPANQAEIIVESLERRGVPHAYLAFEGEGHGFRMAANIQRSLEAELAFYSHVFDFAPADDLPPLDVVNG